MQEEITRNMLKHKEVKEPMLILSKKVMEMYYINEKVLGAMLEYTHSDHNELLNVLEKLENDILYLFKIFDKYNIK